MQFISGDDVPAWKAILPPKLVTDGVNFNGAVGPRSILDGINYLYCGQEKNQNDQNGNNRPRELHLIASINLSRLAEIVTGFPSKPQQGVDQQTKNHQEYRPGN